MKKIPRYERSSLNIVRDIKKHDFYNFQNKVVKQFGDICWCKIFNIDLIYISKKEYIKHVVFDHRLNYPKYNRLNVLEQTFGKYALFFTNDLEQWKKDKIIMMPAFQEKHFEHYAKIFSTNCQDMLQEWETLSKNNASIYLVEAMSELTLKNLLKTLFGDISFDFTRFIQVLRTVLAEVVKNMKSVTGIRYKRFTLTGYRYHRLLEELRGLLVKIIETKKRTGLQENDLLSILITAYEKEPDQRQAIIHIRDELLTFLGAGFETTAAALEWTWIVLAKYPSIARRLREEVINTIGMRPPTYSDLANLNYLRLFFQEVLRMYPPAVSLLRASIEEDKIDGYRIPAGANIVIPISAVHRRPIYWENPEGFDPERFSNIDINADDYLYTYIPFGAGPRICIGKNFAVIEACITIAMVVQKFALFLPPFPDLNLQPNLVLHPNLNVKMFLKKME